MTTYKYIVEGSHPFRSTLDDEVIFTANTDEGATNYALSDGLALLDEMGRPYVYRENTPTSHFGCGFDNCTACNGWVSIADPLTVHGAPLTKEAKA